MRRIFLIFFSNSLGQQIGGNLLAYVTSAFALQPLIPVTQVVSQLVAGVIKLPVAKILDIWGRPQGFILYLVIAVMGKFALLATRSKTFSAYSLFQA